jgi:hypothetical protein
MLGLRDPMHRLDERGPGALLEAQRLAAVGRQAVVAPPPLPGLLDPAALEEAPGLEPVQQGIEGRDVEAQRALRAALDELRDLVAVSGAPLEEGEDEELSRPLLELPVRRSYASDIYIQSCEPEGFGGRRTKPSGGVAAVSGAERRTNGS